MNIKIIGVGKIKEKFYRAAIAEYAKRLGRYCKFEVVEVPDEKAPENLSPAQMAAVTLVSIPLFLVFIFLRKYIMKGVSRSGIKG